MAEPLRSRSEQLSSPFHRGSPSLSANRDPVVHLLLDDLLPDEREIRPLPSVVCLSQQTPEKSASYKNKGKPENDPYYVSRENQEARSKRSQYERQEQKSLFQVELSRFGAADGSLSASRIPTISGKHISALDLRFQPLLDLRQPIQRISLQDNDLETERLARIKGRRKR